MLKPKHHKYRFDHRYKENHPWAVKAMERDNFTCQDCRSDGLNMVVHHIDGSRRLGYKNMNNDLDNLVTLCKSCHWLKHFNREVKNAKFEVVKKLIDEGKSFGDVAKTFGVSRQRIHQIYHTKLV